MVIDVQYQCFSAAAESINEKILLCQVSPEHAGKLYCSGWLQQRLIRERESQLPRGRLWALGWGGEGQQLLVGTGGESTPSGPGWRVRLGWEVHAAAWAGLLLTEEMESQPHAPDAPRRSATCSGLGRTDLMGPEVCGNQGAPSAGAAGPCPCESRGKCCRRGLTGRRGSGRVGFGQ